MGKSFERRLAALELRVTELEVRSPSPIKISVSTDAADARALGPDYTGDDYARTGCKVVVSVSEQAYGMAVHDPDGRWLESYSAASPAALSRMLREWCEGKVPRPHAKSDQASSSGS